MGNTPPTKHFIGTQIQPEPEEKVIINSTTPDNDPLLRPIDSMNIEMDMSKRAKKDMDHLKTCPLCPLCKSDCPSKRFTKFPLELKDPNLTPNAFQENMKTSPETPKSMRKIYKYMTRTP